MSIQSRPIVSRERAFRKRRTSHHGVFRRALPVCASRKKTDSGHAMSSRRLVPESVREALLGIPSDTTPTPSRTTPSDIATASGSRRPSPSPPSMRVAVVAKRFAKRRQMRWSKRGAAPDASGLEPGYSTRPSGRHSKAGIPGSSTSATQTERSMLLPPDPTESCASFGICAALAEFESELIRERTMAGLQAARARGRKGGRTLSLRETQVRMTQAAMAHRDTSVSKLSRELRISPVTLYRYVDPRGNLRDHGKRVIGAQSVI